MNTWKVTNDANHMGCEISTQQHFELCCNAWKCPEFLVQAKGGVVNTVWNQLVSHSP